MMKTSLLLLSLFTFSMIFPSLRAAPPAPSAATASLVDAVECRPRGGFPHFLKKAEGGEPVKVAYLGGSITEAGGWRVLSLKWLKDRYPNAQISEIDAAIAGTGSDFGVFRVDREVLQKHPDLLFVEFATNDGGLAPAQVIRGMEGIVRKALQSNPNLDICFVYTLAEPYLKTLQSGKFQPTASAMEKVADHYNIPSIHMAMEVARLEQEGKLVFKTPLPKTDAERAALGDRIPFTLDGIHPYSQTGHPLYLAAIARSVPEIETASRKAQPRLLPTPLDPQNWENAFLIPFEETQHTGDWKQVDPASDIAKQTAKVSGNRWVASQPGSSISFQFKGTAFGFYGIKGPDIGQFKVTVDHGEPITANIFDSYCTAKRYRIKPWIYPKPLADGEHKVTIEILPEALDKTILLGPNVTISNPADYEGTKLYISDIMAVGEPR